MRVIIQRVKKASVKVEQKEIAKISQGLLLLVGIAPEDDQADIAYLVRKICHLRLFSDDTGRMTHSIKEVGGQILSVSQFTLFAQTKKGTRPSFSAAAKPDVAKVLFEAFNQSLNAEVRTKAGLFGADMAVELVNDGPVTILLDSQDRIREM